MGSLKRITIKGFKSILEQEIHLGRLNVFIGTNGSGKSNFLEAVAMLSSSVEGGVDYERLSRRGARLSSHQIFRSALKNKDRKNTLSIEAETDELIYHLSLNAVNEFTYNAESLIDKSINKKLCGRSNKGATIKGKRYDKIDRLKSIIPVYRSIESGCDDLLKIEKFSIFSPSTPILRGVASDNSNKSPLGLYGGRLAEALSEIIDKKKTDDLIRFFYLLDWFKSVGTTGEIKSELISEHVSLGRRVVTYKDRFMKTNFNDLYAYDVSEGALYVLFVLLLLSHHNSPDFFALDNIDNALNPGLVRNLIKDIASIIEMNQNKQILLTTHNPTALDAIDLFNDNHRLFVVSRDSDGQTLINRISPPEGMDKTGWEEQYGGLKLSEVWLSGAIGGLTVGF